MYNNAIIQTNYKPYIPPPKKKAVNNGEEKQSEPKGRVVNPNDYSNFQGEKQPSSDTFSHSNIKAPEKINIKQVLIDFNSTLAAIGATPDVEEEVKTYLSLVETQSQKENPNKKIITSNLKIAADVLDTYISDTLKKPSKVVKDWVEALLLQNIDFKVDESITKGAFESITGEPPQTAKLAEKKLAEKKAVSVNMEEQVVLDLLKDGEKDFEYLLAKSQISVKNLNVCLTTLEIRGLIRKLPGQFYAAT